MSPKASLLDRYFLHVSIERALFNSYILIFLATALITLLGVVGAVAVDPQILRLLVNSLIAEVIGGVAALFGTRLVKSPSAIKIRLELGAHIDLSQFAEVEASYTLVDPATGKGAEFPCTVYRDDLGWCVNITPESLHRSVSLVLRIGQDTFQGSDWLETRTIELRPQRREAVK